MCMQNAKSLLWALCSLLLFLCAASDKELYHRVQQQLRMCRNIKLIVDYNRFKSRRSSACLWNRRFKPQFTVSALCCICPVSLCWGVSIFKIPSFYLCATFVPSPLSLCLLNPDLRSPSLCPHHRTCHVLGGCIQAVPVAGPQGFLLHIPNLPLCNWPDGVDHVCGEMTMTERRDKDGLIDLWQTSLIAISQWKNRVTDYYGSHVKV